LRDFVMQVATDRFTLLFLREQDLARKVPELSLQHAGLFNQLALSSFTLTQGSLELFAPEHLSLEFRIGCCERWKRAERFGGHGGPPD
ncbi:MAG TPA: hypothetical protein VHF69_02065, partial [Candidatus Synoicihabitans sp.]|nr:hypothetical protein [Candidatus Synoicihabitans sp.]